jgi:enterochelin esterase-like enzyme
MLAKRNAAALRNGTAIRLLAGGQDIGLRPSITAFHELLATLNIPHQFTEVEGAGHLYRAIIGGLGNEAFAFWNRAFGKFR